MKIFAVIILISCSYLNLLSQNDKEIESIIKNQTNKFEYILRTAYKNYVDSINIKTVAEAGINAALKELDPFSQYLNEEQSKRMKESDAGESVGIGADLIAFGDTLTVYSISANSPAEKSGLKRGDKVLFIEGKNAVKMSAKEALELLKGAKNTNVTLIVKRNHGNLLQEFSIKRDEFHISAVICYFMIDKETGYIFLNKFTTQAYSDFKNAIANLKSLGMKNLILDLRNNQGGFVKEAVNIADDFLPNGFEIVNVKTRNKDFAEHYSSSDEMNNCLDFPLVIILNEKSASASEILAGAMQDLDRAVIVGSLSYGKALVQRQWDFVDGSSFRMTIGKYFTPSGRSLQKPRNKDGSYSYDKLGDNIDLENLNLSNYIDPNGISKVPIFNSRKGKSLISIGGIFPNISVKQDTNTLLTKNLKNRNFLLEFAYKYSNENYDSLQKLGKDFASFSGNLTVSDSLLSSFKAYSVSKGIWNEKMFETDKEIIRNYLYSYICQYFFGDEIYYQTQLKYDKQFSASIEQIPNAKLLIKDF